MTKWTSEELALLWRHNNEEIAKLTGRTVEEVGERRFKANCERNNWPQFDPERRL